MTTLFELESLEGRLLTSLSPLAIGDQVAATFVPPQPVSKTAKTSVAASLKYLGKVMDQYHKRVAVYEDVNSAGNHFHAWAKIPDGDADVEMNGSSTEKVHSGATAIKASFTPRGPNDFAGFYMLNGVLPEGAESPVANWGYSLNAGLDLTGATALTFWVRGDKGGEKIEFFTGGVGRNDPNAPAPDSSRRRPAATVTRLTKSWKKVTINLKNADMSYVLGGFGWVASAAKNPDGAVFYLDDINFVLGKTARANRLNQPRFLVSYTTLPVQPDPFDCDPTDDIDLVLRNTAFAYDNALAILAFLAAGTKDGLRRAQLVGDAFVYATTHDRFYTDGRVRTDYAAGDIALPPGWTPNGLVGTTPVAGFYDDTRQKFFEIEQGSVDTGNNAWVMTALLGLHQRTGSQAYLDTATKIGEFIFTQEQTEGTYQGFLGGINNPETDSPTPRGYASVEHNLDINAAFTVMAQITGESRWSDGALHARRLVEATWNEIDGLYGTGTIDRETLNTIPTQRPLDVQPWSILSNAAMIGAHADLFATAKTAFASTDNGLSGFDFNIDDQNDGVWFEGTGQMAVAAAVVGDVTSANTIRAQLRQAQRYALKGNSTGLVAATHDGLTTGFDFVYYRRLHVGATAWNVFGQLGYNPYYSGGPAPSLSIPVTSM